MRAALPVLQVLRLPPACCPPAARPPLLTPAAPPPPPARPPSPPPRAGDSESLKISITHVHRYDLWLLGVWPVQKRKGMRCGSRAIYERMVVKLSRLLQRGRGEGGDDEGALDPGLRRFAGADLTSLTINSGPYVPPPAGPGAGDKRPLALPAPPGSTPASPTAAARGG